MPLKRTLKAKIQKVARQKNGVIRNRNGNIDAMKERITELKAERDQWQARANNAAIKRGNDKMIALAAENKRLSARYEALKAHTSLDFCEFCWEADEKEPMPQDQLWDCISGDTGLPIKLCEGCYESSKEESDSE